MEIAYVGHSCFRIRGRDATSIVTDPFPPSHGYSMGRVNAAIVTISHDQPCHNYMQGVSGSPRVVNGPGEYEIADVLVTGVQTRQRERSKNGSAVPGRPNTAYVLDFDDMRLCHLGDLGHKLTDDQIEALGSIDVLLVPVGGEETIGAGHAAEVVSQLEPKVVVPMHYQIEGTGSDSLESLDRFIREMGGKSFTPQPKLSVTKSALTSEVQIVVLEPRKQ